MSNAIITTLGKLAIGTGGSAVSQRIDFASFETGIGEQVLDGNRNRGKLDRHFSRVRTVRKTVEPRLSMPSPTAFELAQVLQWITGGTPTGSGTVTYPFANGIVEKSIAYNDMQSSPIVHTYANVAVRTAEFTSSDGDPSLSLNLGLIGRNYTTADAWPSLSPDQVDITTSPFVHTDTDNAVVVNSTTIPTRSISIEIENMIPDRHLNSLFQTYNVKVDRQYRLNLAFPLGEAPALYTSGPDGVACSVTYTNGSTALTFTFAKVQFPRTPIQVALRDEIYHQLSGTCYESTDGNTAPLIITLDSTP